MESNGKDIIIHRYEIRLKDVTLCITKDPQIAHICANAIADHFQGDDKVECVTIASPVQNNQNTNNSI